MSEKMLREENMNKNDVQNILFFFAVIQMGNHNEVVTVLLIVKYECQSAVLLCS